MPCCEETEELLTNYLNGRLSRQQASLAAAHLAGCPACRKNIALLYKIKKAQEEMLKEVPEDVLHAAFQKLPDKKNYTALLSDSLLVARKAVLLAKQII